MPDPEFVTDRILSRLSKQPLPAGVQLFSTAEEPVRAAVLAALEGTDIGSPVVIFGQSSERFTVLGDRAVASVAGRLRTCLYGEISDIRPTAQRSEEKATQEFLHVIQKDHSETLIWGPPGLPIFTLWNLLLMIQRLHSSPGG